MANPLLATAKSSQAQPATATALGTRYGVPGNYPQVEPGVRSLNVDQNRTYAPAGLIDSIMFRPCNPGESQAQCDARAREQQRQDTNRVLGGGGSGSGSGSGGLTDAQVTSVVNGVATGVTAIGALITGLVRSGQEGDLERLRIAAAERQRELDREAQTASSEIDRQRLQQQSDMLTQMQQMIL